MKITVAGVGYVGLSLAVLLAQNHEVTAITTTEAKAEKLNKFISPIQDDEIERFFEEANAGERVVVTKILPSVLTSVAAAPLKPYQPNQRINTPSAPIVNECPGIARASFFPFLSVTYFPILGPKKIAPMSAAVPPTI